MIAMHTIGPRLNRPKKPPRSNGSAISPITPAPRAIVLADPAACRHRNNTNNQYASVGTRPIPMQARESTRRQAMKTGRLPTLSASVPHNIGAVD